MQIASQWQGVGPGTLFSSKQRNNLYQKEYNNEICSLNQSVHINSSKKPINFGNDPY
jgi:hypothetical protein